eukprot:scaffold555980_cov15-Prasinocladus_malaysianus.AAC.1
MLCNEIKGNLYTEGCSREGQNDLREARTQKKPGSYASERGNGEGSTLTLAGDSGRRAALTVALCTD